MGNRKITFNAGGDATQSYIEKQLNLSAPSSAATPQLVLDQKLTTTDGKWSSFISFHHKEEQIAVALKSLIEEELPHIGPCFVSSEDILPGTQWRERTLAALREAQYFFLVGSATSLLRPWLNFEAGAAWARGISIIPVLHSGVTGDSLPSVISEHQSIPIDGPSGGERFISRMSQIAERPISQPTVEHWATRLRSACDAIQNEGSNV